MLPVGCGQRVVLEPDRVPHRAEHEGVQLALGRAGIRPELFVAIPEAEVAFDPERLVLLAPPGELHLEAPVGPDGGVELNSVPPVIVAHAFAHRQGRQAGLRARHLPLIVGRGEVVQLAAYVHRNGTEQRPFEAQRIARLARRRLDRDVRGDVRMIEVLVIEHSAGEAERWHEAVD